MSFTVNYNKKYIIVLIFHFEHIANRNNNTLNNKTLQNSIYLIKEKI